MKAAAQDLPMMDGERPDAAFGEKSGLDGKSSREKSALLLTDRRVVRLSRVNRGVTTTFLSLEDVTTAEVFHRPRSARRLFRMALLLAGAGAALLAVDSAIVGQILAVILVLGALHHLYQYVSVSREGTIHFRAAQQELAMPYRGPRAEQAYALVNRFFQLKALLPSAQAVDKGERDGGKQDGVKPAERPGMPFSNPRPWDRSLWYERWFLDRSVPVSSLVISDGRGPDGYETWFLERDGIAPGPPAEGAYPQQALQVDDPGYDTGETSVDSGREREASPDRPSTGD